MLVVDQCTVAVEISLRFMVNRMRFGHDRTIVSELNYGYNYDLTANEELTAKTALQTNLQNSYGIPFAVSMVSSRRGAYNLVAEGRFEDVSLVIIKFYALLHPVQIRIFNNPLLQ